MDIYEEVGQLMGEAAANGLDRWFESHWGAFIFYLSHYNAEDDEWFDILLHEWTAAQKPIDYAPRTYA